MKLAEKTTIKKIVYSFSNEDRKKVNDALDMLKDLISAVWNDCDNVDYLTLLTEECNYSYDDFDRMLTFLRWIADGHDLEVHDEYAR